VGRHRTRAAVRAEGSLSGAVDAVAGLRRYGARTIVSGHGEACGFEVIDEVLGYLQFIGDVAPRGKDAGLSPLDAARESDLAPSASGWTGSGSSATCTGPTPSWPVPRRARRSAAAAALHDMVAHNGGKPLRCLADRVEHPCGWLVTGRMGNDRPVRQQDLPARRERQGGVTIYTDNGYLSVNIINPDRIDDIPAGLSLSAMATGECSFFAYSGPYTVGDGTVEHHIDLCTVQERIGTVQKRLYSVPGSRLVIRSETALAAAEMVRNKLEWTWA